MCSDDVRELDKIQQPSKEHHQQVRPRSREALKKPLVFYGLDWSAASSDNRSLANDLVRSWKTQFSQALRLSPVLGVHLCNKTL